MRAKVAKRLRRQAYGEGGAPRARRYSGEITERPVLGKPGYVVERLTLHADETRRGYQHAKRGHGAGA